MTESERTLKALDLIHDALRKTLKTTYDADRGDFIRAQRAVLDLQYFLEDTKGDNPTPAQGVPHLQNEPIKVFFVITGTEGEDVDVTYSRGVFYDSRTGTGVKDVERVRPRYSRSPLDTDYGTYTLRSVTGMRSVRTEYRWVEAVHELLTTLKCRVQQRKDLGEDQYKRQFSEPELWWFRVDHCAFRDPDSSKPVLAGKQSEGVAFLSALMDGKVV